MNRGELPQAFRDVAGEPDPAILAAQRREESAREMDANYGRADEDMAAKTGRIADGTAVARINAKELQENEEKERKERVDRALLLQAIEGANAFADQRAQDAERLEDIFEARFGDAWREEIANRVMDPDEIPERMDGESIEAYRERLADALIDKMIDPETGQIRPEYRDNPELREYAEWAKARFDERLARNAVENGLTQESLDDLERRAGYNGVRQAAQELVGKGASPGSAVDQATDESRDQIADIGSAQAEIDAFGLG